MRMLSRKIHRRSSYIGKLCMRRLVHPLRVPGVRSPYKVRDFVVDPGGGIMNTTMARHYRLIVVESQSIVGKALCHLLASDRELEIICDARTLDAGCIALHQPG